jgi:hypothetical protein
MLTINTADDEEQPRGNVTSNTVTRLPGCRGGPERAQADQSVTTTSLVRSPPCLLRMSFSTPMCSLAPGSTPAVSQRCCSTRCAMAGCAWSGMTRPTRKSSTYCGASHVCHGMPSRSCFANRTGSTAKRIPTRFGYVPDPTDRKFAALADAANVPLVTSDRGLLNARDQAPFPILKPSEFALER